LDECQNYKQQCAEHAIRIEQSNERHTAAGKRLDHLEDNMDNLKKIVVGRWTFWVVVGLMFSSISVVGYQQNWAFQEILKNQRTFSSDLDSVALKATESASKVEEINRTIEIISKRQDFLRDQNIKMMEKLAEQK
jgi:hypothetical protein